MRTEQEKASEGCPSDAAISKVIELYGAYESQRDRLIDPVTYIKHFWKQWK